jgi:uncharacterized repeat protein (TIGR03803 family)
MYGSTMRGGTAESGVVYRIRYDGTGYRILHHFTAAPTDGYFARGPLVICADGRLYGTTQHGGRYDHGTVFRLFPSGTGYEVLYHFDGVTGSRAYSGLVHDEEAVFGITQLGGRYGQGVVYRLNQPSADFQVIHHFGDVPEDGAQPISKLTQDSDGYLYGTTSGGASGGATVYKTKKDGSHHQVIYSGDRATGLPMDEVIVASDGALFGSVFGGLLFRMEKDGSGFVTFPLGYALRGGLVEASDGVLYGAPEAPGLIVFRIGKDGTGLTNIIDLPRSRSMDMNPRAALVRAGDMLYGSVEVSGNRQTNAGAIFGIGLNGSDYRLLHDFSVEPRDGKLPNALTTSSDLNLYGTTQGGGISNAGTLFRIGRDGSNYELLLSFRPGVEGRAPRRLIQSSQGALYGVTTSGGAMGGGTIFKFSPQETNLTVLRNLGVPVGHQSRAGLVESTNGVLYGTAAAGGASNRGTIFRINKDGGGFGVVHSFTGGSDGGQNPLEGVIIGNDGLLYGATSAGGSGDVGTVYAVRPDGTDFRVLHSFESRSGEPLRPACVLVEALDGSLVGTTPRGGKHSRGSVFKINKDGTGYIVLWHFPGAPDGSAPVAGLIRAPDGSLYGTTEAGGELFVGSIYRIDPILANLSIELDSGLVVVTWPISSTVDELEEAVDLAAAVWNPVTAFVTTNASSYRASLPTTPRNRYFRVRRTW